MIRENQKYQHSAIPGRTCMVVGRTSNGAKVLEQQDNKKPVTRYYEAVYFHPEKGVWKPVSC